MAKPLTRLMIPGPVEVHPDVLKAVNEPVEPHYGALWVEKYEKVNGLLKQVFNTKNDVFLMAGSGTCAIDTCFGSALLTGEKIIIGNNGFFGDRLVSIAKSNGLTVVEVKADWGKKIEADKIQKALADHPDSKMVAMVHSETSTTILNQIDEIGRVVKDSDALFMVDAVSSLGGVPYAVDDWGIDLCASATQKCLGALPGLAPVSVSPKAWKMIDRSEEKGHGWYTNLQTWREYATDWGDWHPTPVTMPVNLVNGLLVSLEQLINEGIPSRMARYKALALQLRNGLREAGMMPFTEDKDLNPVLTAAYPPEGVESSEVVDYLLKEHHIQISGGLGALKPIIFRIGHMSPVISSEDMDNLILLLKSFK
ncbi:MAG TPA: alanine--glyoxylate aminotransferase family protein [Pelolinea sp.]|nr:alanine--glyoxylate aminotransferase family protein [Pelolinea sp.]